MLIKSMRYEIVKPIDVTWDEFGRVLNELRYSSARIANYTVQLLWQWDNFKWEYKEKEGEYPNNKLKPNIYKSIRNKFPEVGVDIIGQTSRLVENRYSSIKKDMLQLKKSVLSFKDNMPIFINNQAYKIFEEGSNLGFDVRLQSKLATGNTRYSFIVNIGERSKKLILQRIISGQYKQGMLQIVRDSKKKWYAIASYCFEPEKREFIRDRIMEVILGKNLDDAITLSIMKTTFKKVLPVNDICFSMKKFNSRMAQIKKQLNFRGESRIGHGREKLFQPIQGLDDKIENYKKTANHKYSKIIIDEAIKRECSSIMVSGDSFFIDWPVFDLAYKLKCKAEESGIEFIDKRETAI